MTPITTIVSTPPEGVETMDWPELAGYLAAIISGARIMLEHGLVDQAIAELRQAEAVQARRSRRVREVRTHIVREEGGRLVEYRRRSHPWVVLVEARVLRADGLPYDDRWTPLSDAGWDLLQRAHPDIGAALLSPPAGGE